ncbi:orexin receptor type 2-like [Lycorma delicatula]|uniref:orexin receptor type 2-like n=1 Tax=Lycorma delicatula TaxID=130591 RepID=UPI003F513D63
MKFKITIMKAVHLFIIMFTTISLSSSMINNRSIRVEENFDIGDVDYIDPSVDEISEINLNVRSNRDTNVSDENGNSTDENQLLANCSNEYCVSDYEYIQMIEQHIFPSAPEWVLIALHCLVFCVGLVGNALVCVAVYRNRTMRTVTNYFIVNLAVADFMVILFCLPPTVVWDVTQTWFMGTLCCKIVLYFQVS